jgi:branched-chain amino acid transport system substrate-binding protein
MKKEKRVAITGIFLFTFPILLCQEDAVNKGKQKNHTVFKVGTTLDLSAGCRQLGTHIKSGIELAFKDANKKGSIPGKRLELFSYDDKYIPENSLNNVNQLLAQNIDLLLCPIAGETIKSYLKIIEEGKLLVIFPLPSIAGNPHTLKCCTNFGPSYKDQAQIVTQQVIKQIKPEKVAILYQNDAPGKLLLNNSLPILKEAKIDTVSLPFYRNRVDFNDQVQKLKNFDPDCIGLIGAPWAIQKLLTKLGDPIITQKTFFVSVLEDTNLQKLMFDKKMRFIASNTVPDPETSTLAIVEEYKRVLEENEPGHEPDITELASYICTSIFVDVISKIKGPLTKKTIIKAFEDLQDEKFKGLDLSFDEKTRQISNRIWLHTLEGKWECMPVAQNNKAYIPGFY